MQLAAEVGGGVHLFPRGSKVCLGGGGVNNVGGMWRCFVVH
jgi:hypothetical protein